jgi:hypothetical protein
MPGHCFTVTNACAFFDRIHDLCLVGPFPPFNQPDNARDSRNQMPAS